MGFFEDLLHDIAIMSIVNVCRDSNGKPDSCRAAGMAFGLGYSSPEDMIRLDAELNRQGAFEGGDGGGCFAGGANTPYFEESSIDWRENCEDGWEYGLYPEDYDTEGEYMEELEQAKYEWREYCEDGSEYGISPNDYEDEFEYELALEDAKESWRDMITFECYGVDPYDYETPEDFIRDVVEIQLGLCTPDEPAAEEAGSVPTPERKDYPNRRSFDAACALCEIERDGDCCGYEEDEIRRFHFILENSDILAARYLTADGQFLFVQAIKENFSLPKTYRNEDEEVLTYLSDVLKDMKSLKPELIERIWLWCVEQFLPYAEYSLNMYYLLDDVLGGIDGYPRSFAESVIEWLCVNRDQMNKIFREESINGNAAGYLVGVAIARNDVDSAKQIVSAFMDAPDIGISQVKSLFKCGMYECETREEVERMELYRDTVLPLIDEARYQAVKDIKPELEEYISRYIDEMETESETYAYSRRNAWRAKYRGVTDHEVCPTLYDDEEAYLEALTEYRKRL